MASRILVIDDNPEEASGHLLEIRDEVEVVHPQHLIRQHLQDASVVLVDHHLEDRQWPERDILPLACQPMNGVALAAIVRAHLMSDSYRDNSPTAVALFSARLQEVTPGLSHPPEYIAAQACGLDWAFSKIPRNSDLSQGRRILTLAEAVESLPTSWPSGDPQRVQEQIASLLGLEADEWMALALNHVERCHPPIHDAANWTDGIAFVRWIAQRVLPYPTFVLDECNLALRLGATPQWVNEHLKQGGELEGALSPASYRGILSGFLGRRWWGAGIDHLLWEATKGGSLDSKAVQAWLQGLTGEPPQRISTEETLILDEELSFDGATAYYSECVRVWPDGWPAYADAPWTSIDRVLAHERLKSIVLSIDVGRSNDEES